LGEIGRIMIEYILYSKENCCFCAAAEKFLLKKDEQFKVVLFDDHESILSEIKEVYNHPTIPIIFRKNDFSYELIGGFTELKEGYDK